MRVVVTLFIGGEATRRRNNAIKKSPTSNNPFWSDSDQNETSLSVVVVFVTRRNGRKCVKHVCREAAAQRPRSGRAAAAKRPRSCREAAAKRPCSGRTAAAQRPRSGRGTPYRTAPGLQCYTCGAPQASPSRHHPTPFAFIYYIIPNGVCR